MAKLSLLAGSTSVSVQVFIQNSSVSTGAGLTGLAYNSGSLVASYVQPGASRAAITLATLAAANSAWSSGGFKEIDSTNCPGLYRLDIPNAALTGATHVTIHLQGATNMVPCLLEIELVSYNPFDGVRLGLTALPNAAAEAAGGLYTRGTGAGQINQPANGMVDTNTVRWLGTACSTPTVAGVPNVNVKTWNDLATVALPLVPTVAGRTLDVSAGGEAGIDWANVGSPTTSVDLSGTTISTSQVVASVSGAVGSVTGAVGSVTGNVGGNVTGSVGSVVGAVGSVTGNVGGNVTGSVGSVIGNVGGSVASIATGGIAAASFAAGAIDAAALAADAGTEIGTAVWSSATRTLTSGGGGSTQVHLFGGWGKSGSTYYWQGAVAIDGSIVTTGISALTVVGVYGNNGNTDLGYIAGTAPTVGTAARLYGSFTLTTPPTDGQPAVLEITFVYNATTYRGRLYSWGIA